MNDEQFNAFADKIQEEIFLDAQKAYGAVGYERWHNMRYRGEMVDHDAVGCITGKCGDTMKMFIKIENDIVADVSFQTDGCGSSSICGSFAAELAIDKTVEEIFDLTGEDVLGKIGQFPENEQHCAYLAMKTVQDAVNEYMIKSCND